MKIVNEDLKKQSRELTAEGLEFLADQVIDSGVLKDIPVVGWAAKVVSAKNTIKDNLYTAKLNKFLTNLHSVPEEKIEEFKVRILKNEEEINVLCEKIIQSLDVITDTSKATLISDLFLAYLDEVIDERSFRESVDVTCYVSVDYLVRFIQYGGFLYYTQLKDITNSLTIPSYILSTPLIEPVVNIERYEDKPVLDDRPMGEVCYSTSKLGKDYVKAIKHSKELRSQLKEK